MRVSDGAMLEAFVALVGALAMVVAMVSVRLRRIPFSAPLLAVILGVALGPYGARVLVLPGSVIPDVLERGCRLLLAVSLMTAALRFPLARIRRDFRAVAVLLLVVLPGGAVAAGALAAGLGVLSLPGALVVGAALAPTDPVLAASTISGRPAEENLPERVRRVLVVEAGLNDGLALPLVLLALALGGNGSLLGWAGRAAYTVAVGIVIGVTAGAVAGRALRYQAARGRVERPLLVGFPFALAFTVVGTCRAVHCDGVLAVFVAGLVFAAVLGDRDLVTEQQQVADGVSRVLVLAVFLALGALAPWGDWADGGWLLVVFAVGALALRRLPLVFALHRVVGLTLQEAGVVGWFGPVGVSGLLYATVALSRDAASRQTWTVVALVVLLSTATYGTTSVLGPQWYRLSGTTFPTRPAGARSAARRAHGLRRRPCGRTPAPGPPASNRVFDDAGEGAAVLDHHLGAGDCGCGQVDRRGDHPG